MSILTKIKLYYKSLKPILLSHHPNCKKFSKHTFRIGKYKFCIGCFIGYPFALIGVIILYFVQLTIELNSQLLFIIGVLFMSSFVLSPLKLTKKKFLKILQKSLFNIGGAFLFWWIFSLPNPFLVNSFLFFFIFSFLLSFVNLYHGYSFYRICKKCEFSLDWKNCPGFKSLFEYCETHDLPNLFKTLNNKN